eukprot:7532589-Heterocapsa_arctica.AAC.1
MMITACPVCLHPRCPWVDVSSYGLRQGDKNTSNPTALAQNPAIVIRTKIWPVSSRYSMQVTITQPGAQP